MGHAADREEIAWLACWKLVPPALLGLLSLPATAAFTWNFPAPAEDTRSRADMVKIANTGVKRDAAPGFLREAWLQIEAPGTYRGQCAERCGQGHGYMPVVVEALPEAEYKAWLEKKQKALLAAAAAVDRTWSQDELVSRGKEVYARQCATCHQPDGRGVPPAFPPLAGSGVVNAPLFGADGKPAKDSHVDRVMNGKPGTAMQAFKGILTDQDLAAVITYERNSFGNHQGDMIQPAQIKALRQEESR